MFPCLVHAALSSGFRFADRRCCNVRRTVARRGLCFPFLIVPRRPSGVARSPGGSASLFCRPWISRRARYGWFFGITAVILSLPRYFDDALITDSNPALLFGWIAAPGCGWRGDAVTRSFEGVAAKASRVETKEVAGYFSLDRSLQTRRAPFLCIVLSDIRHIPPANLALVGCCCCCLRCLFIWCTDRTVRLSCLTARSPAPYCFHAGRGRRARHRPPSRDGAPPPYLEKP